VTRFFHFERSFALSVSGKDSERYLSARLSNDVKKLKSGDSLLAAALTPQGRTEALFLVLKIASDNWILSSDGGTKEEVIAAFRRYIVADRVDLKELGGLGLVHILGDTLPAVIGSIPAAANFEFKSLGKSFVVRRARLKASGFDLLLDQSLMDAFLKDSSYQKMSQPAWDLLRIKDFAPEFPFEINQDYILSESGFESALSHNKGCYVGQEVIEKIDSHGQAPRKLISLELAKILELEAQAQVFADEKAVGKIVTSAQDRDEQKTFCFAYVKADAAKLESFKVGAAQVLAINLNHS